MQKPTEKPLKDYKTCILNRYTRLTSPTVLNVFQSSSWSRVELGLIRVLLGQWDIRPIGIEL